MPNGESRTESNDRKLSELLSLALELPPEKQREALEAACDDPALIDEALHLLDFDADGNQRFLENPAVRLLDLDDASPTYAALGPGAAESEEHPQWIGPYLLLDSLGEGGMGTVYRAMQHEPVERQVAIKMISRGAASPEARRRFDLERQALGRLIHPNIAQLYEAGATDDGRPFVVMELVEGMRITKFCDLHGLTLEERLKLFVDVCRGIQHAHQKQILHRDLKPANILVTEVDGQRLAKVIDFSIARALDQPSDHTFATGNRLVGTPHYISPEGLTPGESGDLDTRADIYSLGVVLFELLVGVRPFETAAIDLPQLMSEILEDGAPRPSVRLEGLSGDQRYRAAADRGTDPEAHLTALRGDLDWIIGKALARDRDQRYGSATELADEIERVLAHQPIEARPPSAIYNLHKWVRRNQTGAALGTLALLGLVVTGLFAGLSWQRAHRAEAQSRLDAETSQQTLAFVLDLFDAVGKDSAIRQDASVRDLLNQGLEGLNDSELPPLAKAEILVTLGEVHLRLGLYPQARELLAESLMIRERELSPEASKTLHSARLLGNLERRTGHTEAAEPLLLRVLASAEKLEESQPLELADALGSLGNLRWSQGRLDDALALHQRALDLRRTHLGNDDQAVAVSHNNLGTLYYTASDHKAAEPHLRQAHAIFEALYGPRHPRVATVLGNLVLVLHQKGAVLEAERLQRRILEIHQEAYGDEHPATATAEHNLAGILFSLSRFEEAEELYESALAQRRQTLGEDHPETLKTLAALGRCTSRTGDYPRAEQLLAEALDLRKASGDGESASAYRLRRYLALVHRDAGAAAEAENMLLKVFEWQEQNLEKDHQDISRTLLDLGVTQQLLGRTVSAEQTLRRALVLQRRLGLRNLHLADTLFALGELLESRRTESAQKEAAEFFSEALKLRQALLPKGHPDRVRSEGKSENL